MKYVSKEIVKDSKAAYALDNVNLNRAEREIASAYMDSAEVFADRVFRAVSGFQAAVAAFGHGCSVSAHRARTVVGKLAHH